MKHKHKLVSLVGTNASGKSDLGVKLALKFEGEIISADSRQVFKGLDLGTGKIKKSEMQGVVHHLIDVADVREGFSLAVFQNLAYTAIEEVITREKVPFIVGGTGLYVDSIVKGYNLVDVPPDRGLRDKLEQIDSQELHQMLGDLNTVEATKIHPNNKRRIIRAIEKCSVDNSKLNELPCDPRYDTLQLGVTWKKDVLHKRVDERLNRRLTNGMVEEVESLIKQGVTGEVLELLGLEYKHIYWYIIGKHASFEVFRKELSRAIKKFAKRQMVWFQRNSSIIWLDMECNPFGEACKHIKYFLG